ncbi:hypothetical protein [Nocardiopsis eucommiae]|uniref:hypothetical protein n=1 Tax=Nocardiopsis eucommiae TaxID=2831970 RepID=UPI003D7329BA
MLDDADHSRPTQTHNRMRDNSGTAVQVGGDLSVTAHHWSFGGNSLSLNRARRLVERVRSALVEREHDLVQRARHHLDITRSDMIPVRWIPRTTGFRVRGDVIDDADRLQVSSDAAERFVSAMDHDLDEQRVVLLGEPGMGKSSFSTLISHAMLRRRNTAPESGTLPPIPVSIPLGSVEFTAKEAELTFVDEIPSALARTVRKELPKGVAGNLSQQLFLSLLRNGELILLLDGFEDLTEAYRRRVISYLSVEAGARFVLTSQPRKYWDTPTSEELRNALLLVAEAPGEEECVGYLRTSIARTSEESEKWRSFIERFQESRDSPVRGFLRTPMRLWLLRMTYDHRGSDPGELFDTQRFPDQASVSDHLYEGLVRHELRAWIPRSSRRSSWLRRPRRRMPYSEEWALRYLAFLATISVDQGSALRWWRLHGGETFTRSEATTALSVALSVLYCLLIDAVLLRGWTVSGEAASLYQVYPLWSLLGISFFVLRALVSPDRNPRSLRFAFRQGRSLRPTWYRGVLLAFLVAPLLGFWPEDLAFPGVVHGIWTPTLAVILFLDLFTNKIEARGVTSPREALKEDLRSSVYASSVPAGTFFLSAVFLMFASVSAEDLISTGLVDVPEGVVHDGFVRHAVLALVVTYLVGKSFLVPLLLIVTLVEVHRRAWFPVFAFSIYLWIRGRTPLRLFRFLDHMVECNLLRPLGSTYRFRHSELERFLAKHYESRQAERSLSRRLRRLVDPLRNRTAE